MRDVHWSVTVDYQQIVNSNIANQIHGFTIDYGKSILTLNSSASVKNNILEQYSLTFLNGLQATKIFQNISNSRVLAPFANLKKVMLKTVHTHVSD